MRSKISINRCVTRSRRGLHLRAGFAAPQGSAAEFEPPRLPHRGRALKVCRGGPFSVAHTVECSALQVFWQWGNRGCAGGDQTSIAGYPPAITIKHWRELRADMRNSEYAI